MDRCRKRCASESDVPCDPADVTSTCAAGIVDCILGPADFWGLLPNINGQGIASVNALQLATAFAASSAVGAVDADGSYYASSFVFEASSDAAGTFTLGMYEEGCAGCTFNGTFVRNENSAVLTQPTNLIAGVRSIIRRPERRLWKKTWKGIEA